MTVSYDQFFGGLFRVSGGHAVKVVIVFLVYHSN